MNKTIEMKCYRGSIVVLDDKIIIDKKNTGRKVIYFNDLIDVEYKHSTCLFAGFFKFIARGTTDTRILLSTNAAILKNPSAVILKCNKESRELADELYDFFLEEIKKNKRDKK